MFSMQCARTKPLLINIVILIHEKEPSEAEPFVLDTFNKCKTSRNINLFMRHN